MRNGSIGLIGALLLALLANVVTAQPPDDAARGRRGPEARGPGERPGPPRGPEGSWPGPGFRALRMPLMVALDADEDGEI
jgi:hypothetical protein